VAETSVNDAPLAESEEASEDSNRAEILGIAVIGED
jgi:hypothetical protein